MTEPLSIFQLVLNASVLVQIVLLLLVFASLVSWVMIFQRMFALKRVQKSIDAFEEYFWSGIDLRQLYDELEGAGHDLTGMETMFVAGFKEYSRLSEQDADPEAVMQGVQRATRVALAREQEKLETNLPFLASVGSTSPYIGLFGTVWGIMNSFRSLANMTQATLASVAPGISEALVATAAGIAVAVEAVVLYNYFQARVTRVGVELKLIADEFLELLAERRAPSAET